MDDSINEIRRRKPDHGRLKCNIDASFFNASNKVGIYIYIRDKEGQRSKTMWFTPLCSVDTGKALGFHHAIRWRHELQLTNVDFEVESKKVADILIKEGET